MNIQPIFEVVVEMFFIGLPIFSIITLLALGLRFAVLLRDAFLHAPVQEKLKNDELIWEEKPKREFILGDDGELLEVVDDLPN